MSWETKLEERKGVMIRTACADEDMIVVDDIITNDAYRLKLIEGAVREAEFVVDVGAHIGTFAILVHRINPKAHIICIEACPENIPALRANVGRFAEVVQAACTHEPGEMGLLNSAGPKSQAGGCTVVPLERLMTAREQPGYVYKHDTRPLVAVTLDEVLKRFLFPRIDLLKLDCEGSEYSILRGTAALPRTRYIVGEYHDFAAWNRLRSERFGGWDYGHMSAANNMGNFHLRNPKWPPAVAHIAVPPGIGDAFWSLLKVPSLLEKLGMEKAHLHVCAGGPPRSRQFLERFDFVAGVTDSPFSCVDRPATRPDGTYNYAQSGPGWHNLDYLLVANGHLERGLPIEDWLPELETDFAIMDRFRADDGERQRARAFAERRAYAMLYFGPLAGNTRAGHNRNGLWSVEDWRRLAELIRHSGRRVVVTGASYDREYYEQVAAAGALGEHVDAVGRWSNVCETLEHIRNADFFVGYQSGLGVVSAYMGVPTAMFWRPHGDSIDPGTLVTFDERMATAWLPPNRRGDGLYLPCIYGRATPQSVMDGMRRGMDRRDQRRRSR